MKPYIEIISRKQIETLSNENITDKTIVISIFSIGDEKPKITKNENIVDILYLQFNDTDKDVHGAISSQQAKMLADFVNYYNNDVERIFFHCDMGISRSAGCAAATMKYLFGSGEPIFNNRKYCPNLRCYQLVLDSFYN